ncbi:hypothetical protein BMF94_1074 [Rhodotorula taiwanensis]|uniref:Uncharacterized protein n=1 Tax=Rhodotorula taiwanensis TaxID=741276 RepID=A0A2S5BGT5_9BASI|nr:hypothetical protein BMF94_1074 [Rhodotorula taiwanensis]
MVSALVQPGLLIAAPYLLPKAIRLGQSFLNPQPKGYRHPVHTGLAPGPRRVAVDSQRLAAFRLFVAVLGISIAVFSALTPPHNLFLSLSAPHSTLSRLFPFLRRPLDIRLATETLARAWSQSLGRPLAEPELALASRLQTLDARLIYVAYGAGPLMHCGWCRAPGAASSNALGIVGLDYLLALAPPTVIAYLAELAACGLLLGGNGRQRWRTWAALLVAAAVGTEAWTRLTWDAGRGAVGGAVPMLHAQIHVLRSAFFAVLLALCYLAPAEAIALPRPGTSTIVAPALAAVAQQTEGVLHRLRALSVARMAVLHKDSFREKITDFWASAAKESKLARSDPKIASALQNQLQRENGPSGQFAAWIDSVMRTPADGPAEVLRRGARPRDQDATGDARDGNSDVEELEEFERVKAEMLAKHTTAG